MLLADINLGDVIWSMLIFFFFIIFLWMIFGIITDIFRSDDLSGVAKALWCIFLIFFPWLMIFVYLIVRGHGMSGRMLKSQQESQQQFDDYVKQTAGTSSAAGEITSAKALLDSGAISQDEFERIKQQALASS
jgi:Short C-terminal domain